MFTLPLYQVISQTLDALRNAEAKSMPSAIHWHRDSLRQFESMLPSGSGIDCGTKIDIDASREDRVVLTFDFHFMNDAGYYDGWGSYKAIITPSLSHGPCLRIAGRDRRSIKDYLHDTMQHALTDQLVGWDDAKNRWVSSWENKD